MTSINSTDNNTTTNTTSTIEPSWKSFTSSQLAAIESTRQLHGIIPQDDPKATYGILCPACSKPNSLSISFCTGCSFPVTAYDIYRLPDNIFLELVKGKDIGAVVCYRDNEYIVFNDKFPVSENHIDIIPCQVYLDISVLTAQHIPILNRLYELGKQQLLSRDLFNGLINKDNIDEYLSAGYNYPVSVKHLHLHMMIPPYKHEKILQYPRWHSHTKVINDLKQYNSVKLYSEVPDIVEGSKEQSRAIENDKKLKEQLANQQQKQVSTL